MDLVFSTDAIEPTKRYAAWQGAICDVYVHVDVKSEQCSDYRGFIREARFGAVTRRMCSLMSGAITNISKLNQWLDATNGNSRVTPRVTSAATAVTATSK